MTGVQTCALPISRPLISRLDVTGDVYLGGDLQKQEGASVITIDRFINMGDYYIPPDEWHCNNWPRDQFCASVCGGGAFGGYYGGFGGHYVDAVPGGFCGNFICRCYAAVIR